MTLTPDPGPEDRDALVELTKALLSGGATAGGFLIGGPIGAGIGAAVSQATASALDRLASRWREKVEIDGAHALKEASNQSGMSATELIEEITADPKLMLLAVAAVNAAGETAMQRKIQLMGKVIANAVTDHALVDEGLLIARAVRRLEEPHFRVLALLADPPRLEADPKGRATTRWSPAAIAARFEWPQSSVTAVLLTLQSESCAILSSARVDGGGATYRDLMTVREPIDLAEMSCEITDFGARVVNGLSNE